LLLDMRVEVFVVPLAAAEKTIACWELQTHAMSRPLGRWLFGWRQWSRSEAEMNWSWSRCDLGLVEAVLLSLNGFRSGEL